MTAIQSATSCGIAPDGADARTCGTRAALFFWGVSPMRQFPSLITEASNGAAARYSAADRLSFGAVIS
jgi:hypothetical protein